MSIVVGTLTIDLKAETSSFTAEMSKASTLAARSANDIKRSLEKIAAVGLAMGAAIATGTAAIIEGALDSVDKLGKMAEASGTTAETLSVLSYAAKLSDVEIDKLGLGLTRLSVSAFKAQNGNQQLQHIFGRLGVSVLDSNGKLRDSGLLMEELAVKFASMGDSAGKTALAVALFGKSGASLIPFLDTYGAKQEEINEQAHKFGLGLDTSTVQLAAQAKEKIEALKTVATGFGYTLLSSTLPALDKLASQLMKIAEDANIPDLGKAFGEKVVTAVTTLGNGLEFAERHAHALKIAVEALAGLAALKIAIPVIADLQAGGLANVGKGIDRLTIGLLGMERVLPALGKFATWASDSARFVGLLAREEGIASAASYAWSSGLAAVNAALSTMAGLLGITTAGLGIFAASLVSEKDAAEKLAGVAVTWGDMWHAAMKNVQDDARVLLDLLKGDLPKAILDLASFQSLRTRAADEAKNRPTDKPETLPTHPGGHGGGETPDTSGLGKTKEDPRSLLLANLAEKLAESQQVLAASGLEEEAQRKVVAQNKASNEIMKLGEEIAKQRGVTTKNYASLVDAATQAIIRLDNAQISDNEARSKLNDLLGASSRQTALVVVQSGLMIAAMGKGSDAIARQSALTQAWNELRSKGASLTQVLTRSQQIYAEATTSENQSIAATIIGLKQELVAREMVTRATLDGIDARRGASLQAKLYVLDQKINTTPAGDTRNRLLGERDALVDLTQAENAQADAQAALSLLSPTEEYAHSTDTLDHAIAALKQLQDGTLTYGQELQIAAKQQDEFNTATDGTIDLLLKEGSMGDGVTAFFLKMQEQAKTTAATIFDVLNETFTKLSDNLTDLITAPNRMKRQDAINAFAGTFESAGKTLLDSQIKQQMQGGLAALGKAFNITLPGVASQLGASQGNAMWVQWGQKGALGGLTASGSSVSNIFSSKNELDDLLGMSPASASADQSEGAAGASRAAEAASAIAGVTKGQPGPLGAFGGLLGQLGGLFSRKKAAQQGGVLSGETLGLPTSLSPLARSRRINPLDTGPEPTDNTPGGAVTAPFGGQAGAKQIDSQDPRVNQIYGKTPGYPDVDLSASDAKFLKANPAFHNITYGKPIFPTASGSDIGLSGQGPDIGSIPLPGLINDAGKQVNLNYRNQAAANSGDSTYLGGDSGAGNVPTGGAAIPFAGQASVLGNAQLPQQPVKALNELENLTGPTPASSSGGNELDDLVGPAPASAATASLQSIPTLLRRSEDLGENPSEGGSFSPPDAQPKTYTQIYKPPPSTLDKVLAAGVQIGGMIGGTILGAEITGGSGSSGSGSQRADQRTSGFGSYSDTGDEPSDNTPGGIVTIPFALGGRFQGPVRGRGTGTSDSINARLSHGEFVTKATSTAKHLQLLHAINEDRVPRFADGGLFGGDLVSPSMAYLPASSDFSAMSARSSQIAGSASSASRVPAGDTHTWNVDARGSNDPAQITAAMDRLMRSKAPQIAAGAVHAVKDGQLRRPLSAR